MFLTRVLKNPTINTILASVKEMLAQPYRKNTLQFIAERTRSIALKLGTNPCQWECDCLTMWQPVLGEHYITRAVHTYDPKFTRADPKNETWQAMMIKQAIGSGLPVKDAKGKVDQDFVEHMFGNYWNGVDLEMAAKVRKKFFEDDFSWDSNKLPFSFLQKTTRVLW